MLKSQLWVKHQFCITYCLIKCSWNTSNAGNPPFIIMTLWSKQVTLREFLWMSPLMVLLCGLRCTQLETQRA